MVLQTTVGAGVGVGAVGVEGVKGVIRAIGMIRVIGVIVVLLLPSPRAWYHARGTRITKCKFLFL